MEYPRVGIRTRAHQAVCVLTWETNLADLIILVPILMHACFNVSFSPWRHCVKVAEKTTGFTLLFCGILCCRHRCHFLDAKTSRVLPSVLTPPLAVALGCFSFVRSENA